MSVVAAFGVLSALLGRANRGEVGRYGFQVGQVPWPEALPAGALRDSAEQGAHLGRAG